MPRSPAGAAAPRRVFAPRNWKDQFLARLAETSNVTASAEAASISLSCVYRNRREDREFGRAWQAALAEGYDNLEMDLLYRLRTGEAQDAAKNPEARKFDNATAFRVLCAHREEVARERARRDDEDEATILAELDAKLERMREREREIAAALLAKDATDGA